MSMYRHLPEKDGILACLLVAEMVARTGKKIGQLIEEMHAEFGYFYSKRVDLKLTPQLKESLAQKLANPPRELDGMKVRDVNTTDGVKLIFDEQTWLLFRLSGTEPVARVYAEACSPKDLKHSRRGAEVRDALIFQFTPREDAVSIEQPAGISNVAPSYAADPVIPRLRAG